jgi:hypothetical protein
MFTRTLLVTLILASASLALTSRGNAGPKNDFQPTAETQWMERASKNYDGGGN